MVATTARGSVSLCHLTRGRTQEALHGGVRGKFLRVEVILDLPLEDPEVKMKRPG